MPGRVVHFEIPYDDAERARAFFSTAFGWQLMPLPDLQYTIVMTGPSTDEGPIQSGFINGGLMERQGDYSGPNLVIDVDNLEDALRAVNDAGGTTVSERMAVGDMGFVAYFRDTEQNLFGLWETAAQPT